MSDSQTKIQQLELQIASRVTNRPASAPGPDRATAAELTDLRKKSAQQVIELESLKSQLAEARRENVSVRNTAGIDGSIIIFVLSHFSGGTALTELTTLREQINKLVTENTRLKHELSAFDLDFFEEIENLKYSHAEATRKLKAMEKMYGPIR
jgi:hypothetical protein